MKPSKILICCACLCLAGTVAPSRAGLDVDLGASVRVGDDTQVFFAVSARYFDRDVETVQHWGTRVDADDLAVALFLSKRSGEPLDALFALRRGGLSWWQVSVRVGVPQDDWFVPVARDPGPPYGKAYGYWKKHRGAGDVGGLTDADARNLVAVRMIHEYYSVPVEVAMEWHAAERDVRIVVSREYGKRHGKPAAKPARSEDGHPGKGRGQGNGQKGHGKH